MICINNWDDLENILKEKDEKVYIILGQEPYKLSLEKNFKVEVVKKKGVYANNKFKEIAFLVTDWQVITASLEAVFNLLFGEYALVILAWLRNNNISAEKFASYLWRNNRVILINRKEQETSIYRFISKYLKKEKK